MGSERLMINIKSWDIIQLGVKVGEWQASWKNQGKEKETRVTWEQVKQAGVLNRMANSTEICRRGGGHVNIRVNSILGRRNS